MKKKMGYKGILKEEQWSEEELASGNTLELIRHFNRVHGEVGEAIDELSYLDFHRRSNEQFSSSEWLEFLSDHRIILLLDKIMLMKMRGNVNKILSDEESKSVAASQKLSASLNFLDKHFDSVMSRETTQYVYVSVPLTAEEERSRNARTVVLKPGEEKIDRRVRR